MNEEKRMCPLCGLPIGEGSIGPLGKIEGKIPVNIQIHSTVSLEPGGPPLWCLGHDGAEYIPNAPSVPQLFYDAFKESAE